MKKQSASRSAFFNPRLLIGFVLCSAGLLLALAGFSKSVAENPAATSAETQNTLFSLTTGTDNTAIGTSALSSNTTDNDNAPSARNGMGMAYDAQRGKVVMFSGYQGCFHCNPDDT